ncbi:MAG TPA: pyridoxamine 5'-phosphate oxidase family protein [Chloroflexota bacterium]|nr:pyridoxamine 5'-phosphate oxidase family protein [Chloroflexota bacterium]
MAQFYDSLNDKLTAFIQEQHLFFVASAVVDGRINLSPKGMDTFRVLAANRVAFMNLTGSGNETAAHLAIDGHRSGGFGRLTIMFCSFTEKPLILRLYGHGRAVHRRDEEWNEYAPLFPDSIGNRNIILMEVESVQTSCGFAVPFYEYVGERPLLTEWAENRGKDGLAKYWAEKNQVSIDGLPTKLLAD